MLKSVINTKSGAPNGGPTPLTSWRDLRPGKFGCQWCPVAGGPLPEWHDVPSGGSLLAALPPTTVATAKSRPLSEAREGQPEVNRLLPPRQAGTKGRRTTARNPTPAGIQHPPPVETHQRGVQPLPPDGNKHGNPLPQAAVCLVCAHHHFLSTHKAYSSGGGPSCFVSR